MQPSRPTPRAPGSFSPLSASNSASTSDLARTRPGRQDSLSSDDVAPLNVIKTRAQAAPSPTPIYASFTSGNNTSSTTNNPQNFSRPTLTSLSTAVSAARSVAGAHSPIDNLSRNGPSPLTLPPATSSPVTPTFPSRTTHSRKHSQNAGLFEPTLPSTSTSNLSHLGLANAASPKPGPAPHREMSASQIAAQAAVMQHQNQQQQQQAQQAQQHVRQRSQTAPVNAIAEDQPVRRGSGGGPMNPPMLSLTEASMPRENAFGGQTYHNGLLGNHTLAATAAANLVFPRSTQTSPGVPSQQMGPQPPPPPPPPPASEKPMKPEKSKVKLFSRQVKIGGKSDPKDKPLPSPGKVGHALASLQRGNFSTTSLESSAQSFYNLPNSSAATIRPADVPPEKEGKEKEKKHHFLSRQKHKLKDDYHQLLSSAMSNSRPTDPSAPSSLYSFNLPQSPAPNSTTSFKSALDLRHGGRALRERRRDDRSLDDASSSGVGSEWPGSSSVTSGSGTLNSTLYLNEPFDSHKYGLNNMTHDDAWPFLKAKLLVVFEAEDLRLPVEDLNRVVTMHIQYSLVRRSPNIIVDDLRELLSTGFSSLDQTLRKTPDDRLIPSLVELWIFTFTSILPYMQAVFLPLDLEFAGNGPLMSSDQARDFWGGIPAATPAADSTPSLTQRPGRSQSVTVSPASTVLEVRRFVLLAFRDIVILPRYDTLKTMFSRLSLEFLPQSLASMALASPPLPIPGAGYHNQSQSINQQLSTSPSDIQHASTSLPTALGGYQYRPNTATSLDPSVASYNSTGSTLLGDSSGSGNRSRAISNVSFGSDGAAHPLRPFTPSSLHALSGVGSGGGGQSNLNLTTTTSNTSSTAHHHFGGSGGSYRDQNVEDSKQVTDMVGRMLQCMSVLASVGIGASSSAALSTLPPAAAAAAAGAGSTKDGKDGSGGSGGVGVRDGEDGNKMIEELNKLLKLNWLGRGRTGRNRRGMVGGRATKRGGVVVAPGGVAVGTAVVGGSV